MRLPHALSTFHRPSTPTAASAWVVALAGLGCAADGPGAAAAGFTSTDSAGVEVVRNEPAGGPDDHRLALREEFRIGVLEGPPELELNGVRDVVVGPEGEIFAALQIDAEIRVFGPDGAYVRTLGRQGQGPGEMETVTWIGVFGDTLLAYDPRLYRMTMFSTGGAVRDTWSLRSGGATLRPRAPTAEGWLVHLDDFNARVPYDIGSPGTDTGRVALVPSVPDALEELSEVTPPWEIFPVVLRYPTWTMWGLGEPGRVFGRRGLWEAPATLAYDRLGRMYVARGSRYAIDVFDPAGALRRRISRAHEPVPVGDGLVRRFRDAVLAHHDTAPSTGEAGVSSRDLDLQYTELPTPDHLPVLGRILASDDGAVWVERPDLVDDPLLLVWSRGGAQPSLFDVFDPDGRFVGTVEAPTRSTVHAVGTDWMVVTERDELDVQYIVRYAMEGSLPGP